MRKIYLKRPEYFFQPSKVWKRLLDEAKQIELCKTPWGIKIEVNTNDDLGRSIFNIGVYDLAVSELLWRLTAKGQFVVDIGANIGYTAGICSFRVEAEGAVYAFEPNPFLQERLMSNYAKFPFSNVQLFPFGLSDTKRLGKLVFPDHYNNNQGVAYVDDSSAGNNVEIQLERLDDLVPAGKKIDVMKIDVEGHEVNVFKGSDRLLSTKQISHIIFEDHNKYPSSVSNLLLSYGYSIYRLEKGWFSISLKDPSSKSSITEYEPTNYLATLDIDYVQARLRKSGYQCLNKKLYKIIEQ